MFVYDQLNFHKWKRYGSLLNWFVTAKG